MPQYIVGPHVVKTLIEGWPEYVIGSFSYTTAVTKFVVTSVAGSGATATLTGLIVEGNIPAIGQNIAVAGFTGALAGFNTGYTPITGVNINAATGQGTITYANATSSGTVTAGAIATVEAPETAEAISANYKSIPVTMQFGDPNTKGERTITVSVKTPTNTSLVATFTLQGALYDDDAEYTALSPIGTPITAVSVPTTAGGSASAEYCLTLYRFFRLLITFTSGSGTVIAKLMV